MLNHTEIHSWKIFIGLIIAMVYTSVAYSQPGDWEPADNPLFTKWGEQVTPANVHEAYPRPQMEREEWKNLNGLWSYSVVPVMQEEPHQWEGEILVPFGIESALSGVKKRVGPDNKLWYCRSFMVPKEWEGNRLLLHFGAVDWQAEVWINGEKVGQHEGGYTSFTLDITDAIQTGSQQQVTVSVWDPTDDGFQPRGKQVRDPRGIWYTPTTGIWQTVWLEPIPEVAIEDLKMTPDIDNHYLHLKAQGSSKVDGYRVTATAYENGTEVSSVEGALGEELNLSIPNMKLWSPQNPFLYDLTVSLHKNGEKIDEVDSYFGMREIRIGKADDGFVRLFLNDEPLFHYGLLDQGFWPDGLYTAPSDEALKYDIQVTKNLGYNMIRKHVKVEPDRWYYWADKLGVLVWQDMPNGDDHIGVEDPDLERVAQSAKNYKKEFKEVINQFYNHPSIVTWVPFNEGWGQFETANIANYVKELDDSRLVDATSGWADRGVGDMHDIHRYPGPGMPDTEQDRAAILGEFGGQALAIKEHLWIQDFSRAPDHFKTSQSMESLHERYNDLIQQLYPLKEKGLAGAVYTQTTDVESEVNGIMTYDREVIKFDEQVMRELHQKLTRDN